MRKNMTLTLLCVFVLTLWAGIECYQNSDDAFETEYQKVTVAGNDTVWKIAENYFDKQDRYNNFDEFLYYVRKDNNLVGENAKLYIQPGDELIIKLNKRKR